MMDEAFAEAAARCDKLVCHHVSQWRRYAKDAGQACDEMLACEYYHELGFPRVNAYSKARFGKWYLVKGLAYHHRLSEQLPHFHKLWKAHIITPMKLAACGHLITPSTAWFWLPLLLNLHAKELAGVARHEAAARKGTAGPAVFVPMWIPEPWYKRYWAPRDASLPAFQVMQAMLKEAES